MTTRAIQTAVIYTRVPEELKARHDKAAAFLGVGQAEFARDAIERNVARIEKRMARKGEK